MQREFLGWEGMPLENAARWLADRFGERMERVLVALPGARAGRLLSERLALLVGPGLRPPTVITGGQLSDSVLEIDGVPAGRLVRTFAWLEALRSLGPASLARVVARPPRRDDLAGWMGLAEEVRGLFGEVAAEGLDFHQVAAREEVAAVEGERRRWLALAEAQDRMGELLASSGTVDPHLARLAAIDGKRLRDEESGGAHEIVLVGIVEMNALTRRALELSPSTSIALVFAPEPEADAFDPFGVLHAPAWAERHASLDHERHWLVVDGPVDQARAAVDAIASWRGAHAAEQITIGLGDAEVAPHLLGALAEHGVVARDAAGTPLARTAPVLFLSTVARFLTRRDYVSFVELVRHPDFERALRQCDEGLQPVSLVDAYYRAHLPWRADGQWLAEKASRRDRELQQAMTRLWEAVHGLLGGLLESEGERLLCGLVPGLRALLERVYAGRSLEVGVERDRVIVDSLRQVGAGLAELEELPEALAPLGDAAGAIDTLLAGLRAKQVPPAPARAGEPTIELLGWLELALDDAPALVVTGFEDGRVPESVRGDAYLPNSLRKRLGLTDDDRRLARDLYATELLLGSRRDVVFVTGRRSLAGDPQVPSRIVFHCDPEDVVPRVERFLRGAGSTQPGEASADSGQRELPRAASVPKLEKLSVTAFRSYLASPYLFYLEHVLGLETLDDRARELDPMGFGILAHGVLQRFGEDESARDESDAEKIAAYLSRELGRMGAELYGTDPLPAVRLQLEQLDFRLSAFAEVQAARRRAGWRIRETEWSPSSGHHGLDVDGETVRLTGRIDRIDYNETTGAWAIWDYKTGDTVKKPVTAHRDRSGEWVDLQLPLYCVLAAELIGDEPPLELGYAALGRSPEGVGFLSVKSWARTKSEELSLEDGVGEALDVAADVVRKIRRGEFFDVAGFSARDPILGANGGMGLLTGAAHRQGDEIGEEAGA